MQVIHNAMGRLRSNAYKIHKKTGNKHEDTLMSSSFSSYIRNFRNLRIAGTLSSLSLIVLTLLAIFPIVHKAMEAEAASPLESDTNITMTIGKGSANLSLTPKDTTGTFSSSSASDLASFGVVTNNYTGYTLGIKATDDTKQLVNKDGDTTIGTLESITSTIDSTTFNTQAYNGKWGYKPSKYNSTDNASFRPAPTTSSSTLDVTNSANSTSSNTYTIGLGARADYNTPAGNYTKTFILTAVGNPVPYTIKYLDNTGDTTVTGLPPTDSGATHNTSLPLSTATPTRTGYTFKSWCLGTVSNNGTTCTGTEHNKGTSLSFVDQTIPSNIAELYATWTANTYTITLTNTNATTPGSTAARVTYNSSTVYGGTSGTSAITNPSRSYTISGFDTSYNNASGATVSSTSSKTYSYSFDGWYTEASNGTRLITSAKALVPSVTVGGTNYTNASSQWVATSGTTLHAHWANGTAITLPTITKTGHTCGWTTSTSTSAITYASGYSGLVPTANMTLHGVCTVNSYSVKVNFAGSGVSSVTFAASGYTSRSVTTSGGTASLIYNVPYTMTMAFTPGYEFESWALNSTNYGTLSSISDNPATFTIKASNDGIITATGKESMRAIQDITPSTCTTTAKTVYDTRDNQQYTIQKLADGNCWMMTNLNLGAVTLSTDLTSSNTNLSTTITASNFNSYKKTSGTATYTTAEYIPVSGNDTSSGGPGTPYGTLYNYCAASAGTICTSSNSSNATYDICPKGWRLPTGGSSGEFQALYNNSNYNTPAKMRAPVSQGGAAFALAGSFYNAAPTLQGSYGYYWSSTRLSSTNMYYLYLSTSYVNPANNDNRSYGSSIRCVLNVPTMQDFTATEAAAMATGEAKTLYDSRDGQDYTVAKLPDGKVWMTKNLNLAGGTALTPADSNVSAGCNLGSNCTLPASSTPGSSDDSTAYVYNSGSTTCGYGSPCYSYYSYVAATAGTNPSSGNATSDICPKGWRLPTQAEFNTLISSYTTGAALTASPFLGVYAGRYINSSFINGGDYGYYWSSAADDSIFAYYLDFFRSGNANVSYDRKRLGLSMRCVLKPTMQGFTASDAAAMATGETKTLADSRDGQDYTVAKLPDGNVWMTQNLRFTGTSIDSTTTNINTTKTLSYGDLTSGNSDTQPRIHNSGNATTGVWYNYCAATAGTICTDSNSTEASYSLCPAGWRLPTFTEQYGITSYTSAFSPVTGGEFYDGSLYGTGYGYWWSSTAYDGNYRRLLSYNGSSLSFGSNNRYYGNYVRCVRSS